MKFVDVNNREIFSITDIRIKLMEALSKRNLTKKRVYYYENERRYEIIDFN